MGFGETESRSALLLANNSLMDASEILVNMASRSVEGGAPDLMWH